MARLSEGGVTYPSFAAELGVSPGQLQSWQLELLAAGSAAALALAQMKAEAAELAQLRRDYKRLKEENDVMRIGYSLSNFRILIQVSENPHPTEGFLNPPEFDTL